MDPLNLQKQSEQEQPRFLDFPQLPNGVTAVSSMIPLLLS